MVSTAPLESVWHLSWSLERQFGFKDGGYRSSVNWIRLLMTQTSNQPNFFCAEFYSPFENLRNFIHGRDGYYIFKYWGKCIARGIARGIARASMGRGERIFIYLCSAQLISFNSWSNEAQVIASFNLSWLVKQVIKRSASSRKDLKIAMPVARVRVIQKCWNIKLDKTRDYWTREHVFHGTWSWKICLSWHLLSKRIASVRKSKKTCDEIWTSSNHSQINASQRKSSQVGGQTRHKSTQVKTCDDLRSRLIGP